MILPVAGSILSVWPVRQAMGDITLNVIHPAAVRSHYGRDDPVVGAARGTE